MLVASSWSIISSLRLGGFFSLSSRRRRSRSRSRSRRLASRCFFSSSVMPLSASIIDESEFLRGRLSGRRCGDREGSGLSPRSPFSRRARSASSCDRVGRWLGGGPLRSGRGAPSRYGGGGPRRPPGGGGFAAPSGLGGAGLDLGSESSSVKEPWGRSRSVWSCSFACDAGQHPCACRLKGQRDVRRSPRP